MIGDKECKVHELILDDYAEIENFIKSQYAKLYRSSAEGLTLKEVHDGVMEILRTDISVEELQGQMKSSSVQLFTAYIAVRRKNHVTLDNYKELLDSEAVGIISDAISALSGEEEEEEENPPQADQVEIQEKASPGG